MTTLWCQTELPNCSLLWCTIADSFEFLASNFHNILLDLQLYTNGQALLRENISHWVSIGQICFWFIWYLQYRFFISNLSSRLSKTSQFHSRFFDFTMRLTTLIIDIQRMFHFFICLDACTRWFTQNKFQHFRFHDSVSLKISLWLSIKHSWTQYNHILLNVMRSNLRPALSNKYIPWKANNAWGKGTFRLSWTSQPACTPFWRVQESYQAYVWYYHKFSYPKPTKRKWKWQKKTLPNLTLRLASLSPHLHHLRRTFA